MLNSVPLPVILRTVSPKNLGVEWFERSFDSLCSLRMTRVGGQNDNLELGFLLDFAEEVIN